MWRQGGRAVGQTDGEAVGRQHNTVVGSPDSVATAAVLEEARFEDAEGRGEPVRG